MRPGADKVSNRHRQGTYSERTSAWRSNTSRIYSPPSCLAHRHSPLRRDCEPGTEDLGVCTAPFAPGPSRDGHALISEFTVLLAGPGWKLTASQFTDFSVERGLGAARYPGWGRAQDPIFTVHPSPISSSQSHVDGQRKKDRYFLCRHGTSRHVAAVPSVWTSV